MTRKHFEIIAQEIKAMADRDDAAAAAYLMVKVGRRLNARFKAELFLQASGVEK